MPSYSIYVRSEENNSLKRDAKSQGLTPVELIKKRLEQPPKDKGFIAVQAKLDALFLLLEMLATEIGYTSGATRAASASISKAVNEGVALEASLKRAAQTLRQQLAKDGAEVCL